ncbi:putative orfan [Tupanvirus soda lake]|uniref:Orfan n=2 Tax=Tupanvirus TaxID=2094720 RepID=A0AC62AAK5_9VIRU|nr:putative orfan [Tupanvirus soda lake]QKU34680.1 putative orfan [Tupanvirus soda lake]
MTFAYQTIIIIKGMISIEENKNLLETIRAKMEALPSKVSVYTKYDILSYLSYPQQNTVTAISFTKHSNIRINGEINFNFVIMNCSCMYRYNKSTKGEEGIIKLDRVKYLGIKIYDLFKILLLKNKMILDKFENDKQNIANKILKVDTDETINPVIGYCGNQGSLFLIENRTYLNHNINNFANNVVLFTESCDLYTLFYPNNQANSNYNYEKGYKYLNQLLEHISKPLLQSIINAFYFNNPNINEISTEIVFVEPRSLISIMEEYHSNQRVYHILKKLIKKNECPVMVFSDIDEFMGKSSDIIPIEYFDKIYFIKWDIRETNRIGYGSTYWMEICPIKNITTIIEKKITEKKKGKNYFKYCYRDKYYIDDARKENKKYTRLHIRDELKNFRYDDF